MSHVSLNLNPNSKIREKAEYWADRVGEALDYYCWNIYDDALECYMSHSDKSLGDLIDEFSGDSYPWISEKEANEFDNEKDEVIQLAESILQERIEEVVNDMIEDLKSDKEALSRFCDQFLIKPDFCEEVEEEEDNEEEE